MLKLWDDLREVFTPGKVKMDAGNAAQLTKAMHSYFHPEVCRKLNEAIVNGPVGMDDEVTKGDFRGTFPKRIQQYLLKTYEIQLSDNSNIITDLLGQLNKNKVTQTLYAMFTKKIEWSAGDFGDSGSCYWGCNAITRYFLSNWNCFRAMKFYTRVGQITKEKFDKDFKKASAYYWQDGYYYQGFGRCLTAVDFPVEGAMLMWNAYPNGEYVTTYLQGLLNGIEQINPALRPLLLSQDVKFCNQGNGGGWFYTNGRASILVGEKKVLQAVGTTVDLGYEGTPDKTKLNEYSGECQHCKKRGIWKDRPSIEGKVCEYCIGHYRVTCGISGAIGFGPNKDARHLMALDNVFKLVYSIKTGGEIWVSPKEFAKLDMTKYEVTSKYLKKVAEPVVAGQDMHDMEDDYEDDYEDEPEEDEWDLAEDDYEDEEG